MGNKSIKLIIKQLVSTKKGEMLSGADGVSKSCFLPIDKIIDMFPSKENIIKGSYYEGYIIIPSDYIIKWEDELNGFFKGDQRYLDNTYRKKTQPLSEDVPVPAKFLENVEEIKNIPSVPNSSMVLPPIKNEGPLAEAYNNTLKDKKVKELGELIGTAFKEVNEKIDAILTILNKGEPIPSKPNTTEKTEKGIEW